MKNKVKTTLSETSKDDDGMRLLIIKNPVYNFDRITSDIAAIYRAKKPHKSCDALYIKDDAHIYLMEFKNVRKSGIPKKNCIRKVTTQLSHSSRGFFPLTLLSRSVYG